MKTNGGQSFDKTMMSRYDLYEMAKIADFYSSSVTPFGLFDIGGSITHLSHYVRLKKIIKSDAMPSLSSYSVSKLIQSMCTHVLYVCGGSMELAVQISPVYRLSYAMKCFLVEHPQYKSELNLHSWFEMLTYMMHPNPRELFRTQYYTLMSCIEDLIMPDNYPCPLASGDIFRRDLVAAHHVLDTSKCTVYSRLEFNGCKFRGRGVEFMENEPPQLRQNRYGMQESEWDVHNPKNSLNDSWFEKPNYSSWCRYNADYQKIKTKHYKVGQLNYFYRISVPDDEIVHGLAMASIVSRKHEEDQHVVKVLAEKSVHRPEDFDVFIPVVNIVPSAQLVAPFNRNSRPILIAQRTNLTVLHHVRLLNLHPGCKDYRYEDSSRSMYNNFSFDID